MPVLKNPKAKSNAGRPSAYKPEFVQQAEKLCNLGATDVELADFFSVSVATISNWKNRHPEFLEALKTGKEKLDERVERSLYHRAIGYTFDSEKVFQFQGQIVRTPIREHVPPDTTAAIFWLKNRKPAAWRDVQKHEHGGPGDFDRMTEDELRNSIARDLEELGAEDLAAAVREAEAEAGPEGRLN